MKSLTISLQLSYLAAEKFGLDALQESGKVCQPSDVDLEENCKFPPPPNTFCFPHFPLFSIDFVAQPWKSRPKHNFLQAQRCMLIQQ
jgi:hypothetical protein